MSDDPWAVFESDRSPAADTVESRVECMALEYATLEKERAEIDERMGALKDEISHYAPEDTPEHTWVTDCAEITVQRTERWTWDQEKLKQLFGDREKLPDYVKHTYSVDKRSFKKLPQEEQEQVKTALTRTFQQPRVKVKADV